MFCCLFIAFHFFVEFTPLTYTRWIPGCMATSFASQVSPCDLIFIYRLTTPPTLANVMPWKRSPEAWGTMALPWKSKSYPLKSWAKPLKSKLSFGNPWLCLGIPGLRLGHPGLCLGNPGLSHEFPFFNETHDFTTRMLRSAC